MSSDPRPGNKPSFPQHQRLAVPMRFPSETVLARRRQRIYATVIDLVLFATFLWLSDKVFGTHVFSSDLNIALIAPAHIVYLILTELLLGVSVGKRVLKLSVGMRNSNRPSIVIHAKRATIKTFELFIYLPSVLGLAILLRIIFAALKIDWLIVTFTYRNNQGRSLADIVTNSDVFIRESRWGRDL